MLYVNFCVKCPNYVPKWPGSYFQPILVAIFVTIAIVKVELIPDSDTLAISSNKNKVMKTFFYF